jgi:enamine deaminase RidA (YjgF/YER057c/UK114 family)
VLEGQTASLYQKLFAAIQALGYPHLLRTWNYFPQITDQEAGQERYHAFSVGRHAAYAAHGWAAETAPAASALGTVDGPLTILFLAAKKEGQPIENPRQISAYHYPKRYGPKSPIFARALLSTADGPPTLFISGTASIVGHESRHPGDVRAQLAEILTNIEALLDEARKAGLPAGGRLSLKAYIRDPATAPLIEETVRHWLGAEGELACLNAEICREELLVEIEGICQ